MISICLRFIVLIAALGCTPTKGPMADEDNLGDVPSGDTSGNNPDTEEDSGSADNTDIVDTGEENTDPPEEPAPVEIDYSRQGPFSTSTSSAVLSASCSSTVHTTIPTEAGEWPRVILAHGFMRGPSQMEGWAEHLASWGLEIVVPTLCHASVVDTDHEANGRDLVTLNDVLGGGEVIYAGHSAGGLAALIAASLDPHAIGLIGLDLTDAEGIGVSHANRVTSSTFALAGEASTCNNDGNGVTALSAVPGSSQVRVTDADHCDFENETDWMCTSFCGGTATGFTDGEIQRTVLGLMTAATMSLGAMDPDAASSWWTTGGSHYDNLLGTGSISRL